MSPVIDAHEKSWTCAGTTFSEMWQPSHYQLATTFIQSRSLTFSVSLGILHEWMTTQMRAKPSSNLLQRIGGDHRGSRAQLRTLTCLRWILGYMRLDIWHKIGLSGDWCLSTRSSACYYWTGFVSDYSRHLANSHVTHRQLHLDHGANMMQFFSAWMPLQQRNQSLISPSSTSWILRKRHSLPWCLLSGHYNTTTTVV